MKNVSKLKFISFILLWLVSLSLSPTVGAAKKSSEKTTPYWLLDSYSGGSKAKTGFVGQSKKWSTQDAANQVRSIDEACKDASRQVAEFFSVRIESSVNSQLSVSGNEYFSRFEQNATIQSNVELEGINRSDTFTQYFDKQGYILSYCLIELTSTQINKTKKKLEKEQQKIDHLTAKIIEQLTENNFDLAKLSMAQLKSLNVDNGLIIDLENLLEELQEKDLRATLNLSKNAFRVGEYLSFTLASNNEAYVYVFLEGARNTRMLFPSPQSSFNLLVANEPLSYPLKVQVTEGEAYRLPKTTAENLRLRLVASVNPLNVDFLITSFSGYSISEEHSYHQFITDCELSTLCKVDAYEVEKETSSQLKVSSYIVKVNGKSSSKYKSNFKQALRKQGVTLVKSGKKVIADVTIDVAYSKRVDANIYVLSGELLQADKNGEMNRLSRSRVTGIHDDKRLSALMDKLHNNLIKKAL